MEKNRLKPSRSVCEFTETAQSLSKKPECLVSGYLKKEPETHYYWGTRFCILYKGEFHWFLDSNDTKSHGSIDIGSCKVIKESQKEHTFKIVCHDMTYRFACENKEELNHWLTILQKEFLILAPKLKCKFEDFVFPGYTKVDRYIIDLDKDPKERWTHIIDKFIDPLKILSSELEIQQVHEIGSTEVATWISMICHSMQSHKTAIIDELTGIAAITTEFGLTYEKLMVLNVGYSLLARCTSGNVDSKDGSPYHFRTMDWDMEILRKLTIEVEYQKKGVPVFIATQWVGFVGILTGMRVSGWSISLNYRYLGLFLLRNFLSVLASYEPIEFLIRELLEGEPEYDKAIKALSSAYLVSPCYLTVTGNKTGEGCIITRDRQEEQKRLSLHDSKHGFLVQTNIDHWVNVVDPDWAGDDDLLKNSLQRRDLATKLLKSIDRSDLVTNLFTSLIDQTPVMNYQTIYQVVMSPGNNFYESRCVLPSVPQDINAKTHESLIDRFGDMLVKTDSANEFM
jgi:hypothetical protein